MTHQQQRDNLRERTRMSIPITHCPDCKVKLTAANRHPKISRCRECGRRYIAIYNKQLWHKHHPESKWRTPEDCAGISQRRPQDKTCEIGLPASSVILVEHREGAASFGEYFGGVLSQPTKSSGGTCPHCYKYYADLRGHTQAEHVHREVA